jgi:AcrR family transcriptional regulator
MTQVQGRSRAAALPLEERRAAIVKAALPLFLEHGAAVTTREIAQAAGIAEGTIFRVFDDKTALLEAVIDAAIDPDVTEAALRGIDPDLPLDDRLIAAVDILGQRVAHVFHVMSAASTMASSEQSSRDRSRWRSPELIALVELFESEAEHISREPVEAARLLRGLTFAGTHPSFAPGEPLSSEEIVAVLLDGIRRSDDGEPSC